MTTKSSLGNVTRSRRAQYDTSEMSKCHKIRIAWILADDDDDEYDIRRDVLGFFYELNILWLYGGGHTE